MSLSPAQLAAIKADIAADPTLSAFPNNSDGNDAIRLAYNLLPAVDFWVWRTFVPDAEITGNTTVDGTAWSWTAYIARSQGERDAWRQMVNMAGGINASLPNVRSGVADIFSGAGGTAQRTHLLTIGRRKATRIEKLLATPTAGGVGNPGITSNPATMTQEGGLTGADVEAARNS